MIRTLIFILLLTGCNNISKVDVSNKTTSNLEPSDTNVTRTAEYQAEIDALLLLDRNNKIFEENCLREIAIAQDNSDEEAYKFYFAEYMNIPRIPIPEWMFAEPNFYPRKSAKDVVKEYREQN